MISMIACLDKNNGIGKNDSLLFRIQEDLEFFKSKTVGKVTVMGSKTFCSLGKCLPNRIHIVLTRKKVFESPFIYSMDSPVYLVKSVRAVLETYENMMRINNGNLEFFIIGGEEIYREFMPYADRLYITKVNAEASADTFFPEIKEDEWFLESSKSGAKSSKLTYEYSFNIYERVRS